MLTASLLPAPWRRCLLLGCLWLLLLPGRAAAQGLPAPVRQRIDSVFALWNQPRTPGAVVGVIWRGKLVYQRAYGQANLSQKEPLTVGHRFWVASLAKQFTAAAVLLLAEQGRLRLDEDIRRYLPELPWLGDTVRVRHLLHHTSGLRDGFTLIGLTLRGERHYTNANVLRMLSQQRGRNFRPGERFEYNNGGYVLLAEIVARVAGQPLAVFAEQQLFRPLGMAHTRFDGQISANMPGLATGYTVGYRRGQPRYRAGHFRGNTVGSSGLTTTLADLVRWDQSFYGNFLNRPGLLQRLLMPGRLHDGRSAGYAAGLEVGTYRGQPVVAHSGADPGYQAQIVRFPEQQLTLICLANTQNLYGLTAQLLRLAETIVPAAFTPEAASAPAPAGPAPELAGIYLEPGHLGEVRVLSFSQNELRAARSVRGYAQPLRPAGPDVYVNRGLGQYRYQVEWAADGTVRGLRYTEWGHEAQLQKTPPATPSAADLRRLAGRYYCPELGQHYRLTARRGQLRLSLYRLVHVPLQPVAGDKFLADLQGHNCLAFQRDAAGAITGFSFHREAINGLRFQRVR
jgi:CubicO group peptidase (beta-lactamase class C family)